MYCCFFDVDGVLLDFEGGFTNTVKDYFKLELPKDFVSKSFWFEDILTKEQVMEGWLAQVPEGRLGLPEEVGAVIAFLASPAGAFIRGVSLPVDGGRLRSI